RGYLAERADVSARFRSFVGQARILKDPKHRLERLVYRGIQEARDQVTRQTVRQEIRGGELLQDVISRRDIQPVFQPVFDLATGNMIGMEALSRGPRGSEFESGETLFSPAAASDPEFLGPLFRNQVMALGLEPDRIVLEITERTYAVYEGLFREVLSKFRSQNFRIAVDDVGTGYSNLSSLADIEPDYLKFDNVFVRGIDRRQVKQDLLEALMSFARKMHTKVIAEGIETREELRVLQSLGVPYGQGFLLARPMPVSEIERFATIAI